MISSSIIKFYCRYIDDTSLLLDDNKFSLYRKHTFTGQYTHFDSFVPWKHRIAWIRSLLSRIHKICSPTKLSQELQFLKKITCWNGYPKQVVSTLIQRFNNTNLQATRTTTGHLNSFYDTKYLDSKTNNELTEFLLTNSKIIDSSDSWNLSLFKEALHIKRRKSILSNGLKASRELQLFN